MKLPQDIVAFSERLARFAEQMDAATDSDQWGPYDTAEAAENLLSEYLELLEGHR